jgi:hypothetical protein
MRDMGATRIVFDGIQVEFNGVKREDADVEETDEVIDGIPIEPVVADWALRKQQPKQLDLNDWFQQQPPPQLMLDEES